MKSAFISYSRRQTKKNIQYLHNTWNLLKYSHLCIPFPRYRFVYKSGISRDLDYYRMLDCKGFCSRWLLQPRNPQEFKCFRLTTMGNTDSHFTVFRQGKHTYQKFPFNPHAITLWILLVSWREDTLVISSVLGRA